MADRRWIVGGVVAGVLVVGGVGVAVGMGLAGGGDEPAPTPVATVDPPEPTPGPTPEAAAPAVCDVEYTVRDQWPGGFTADVTVHNLDEPLDGWTLAWTFAGDERVENIWNAELTSAPADLPDVVVHSVDYNAELGRGASVTFGFNGSGTPGEPTGFRLADRPCGPGTQPEPTAPADGDDVGAAAFYLDPGTKAAAAAASATGEEKDLLTGIAETPQAFWVTDRDPATAAAAVRDYTTRADRAGRIGVVVVYAIPGRDCGLHSAGGTAAAEYQRWVDAVADAVVGEPWVVLEPDALPQLGDCAGQGDRAGYLRYAAQALTDAGARVYIDVGHSSWLSAEEAARRLNEVGVADVAGFALNTSNYQTTADSRAYGERVSALTGGAHFVVDVSRNGNGSNGEWCNPRGRALGEQPRLVDDGTHLDALLWVKLPGESDGPCNGGPAAGEWWQEIALELARNAR